jgi:hypothetical protein
MAKRKRRKHPGIPKVDEHAPSFQVSPKNQPEIIDYYLTSPDGKNWTKNPGNVIAMISGFKPEDLDEEIMSIINPISELANQKQNRKIGEKLTDCRHKLHAVRYHLQTIRGEIVDRVKEFERNYSAGSGIAQELENPRLVYETEALLFQVKSSLDILTQTLGCVIPPLRSNHSFKSKTVDGAEVIGGKVIDALLNNGFEDMGNLFESDRTRWIQDLVEMRDTITHYSRLRHFHCFIEAPYMGGGKVSIHYPTMPSGIRVDNYCQASYTNLLNLHKSVFTMVKL